MLIHRAAAFPLLHWRALTESHARGEGTAAMGSWQSYASRIGPRDTLLVPNCGYTQ